MLSSGLLIRLKLCMVIRVLVVVFCFLVCMVLVLSVEIVGNI